MVLTKDILCPHCGGALKHYDTIRRLTRGVNGVKDFIFMERKRCVRCCRVHRVIPDIIYPYKHYLSYIIDGFVEGQLSIFDLDFEDFPDEATIERWKNPRVDIS